jgi:hypothetical protein
MVTAFTTVARTQPRPGVSLRVLALLAGTVLWGTCCAVEAHLELPDPLIPDVQLQASVVVTDAQPDVQDVTLPVVPGVSWTITGRNSSVSSINGAVTRSYAATIALRVSRSTAITFPPITITLANGRTLATNAVTVSPHAANPALQGEAYAEARFEPARIVPGEETTLIYRVYLKQDRDRAIKEPGIALPSGSISLGNRRDSTGTSTGTGGESWSVQTFRWPLTIAQPGRVEVGGQQEFYRCRREGFPFDQLEVESTHELAIKPAILEVEALPLSGRPADFTGLFGPLSVSASLDRTRINADEGTVLAVQIRGRQIGLLKRPVFNPPNGLQAYAKADEPGASGDSGQPEGEREFRWDIVPSQPGTYAIPSFSVPYFDPATRRYERAESSTLALAVLPGHGRIIDTSATPAKPTGSGAATSTDLPPPLRGHAGVRASIPVTVTTTLGALMLGLFIGGVQRRALRGPRHPHRGRTLVRAVATQDAAAIASCAQALLPSLADPAKRAAAERLMEAAELTRFGGQPLPADLQSTARLLEDQP